LILWVRLETNWKYRLYGSDWKLTGNIDYMDQAGNIDYMDQAGNIDYMDQTGN